MKECFIITTYCDTNEKIKLLNKTIEILKNYNIDICIHAHYPLPKYIQNLVNYYIFDKSNINIPLSKRKFIYWNDNTNIKIRRCVHKQDHSFSVLSQWKQSFNFFKKIGYNRFYFINYDVKIKKDLLDEFKKYKNDCVCLIGHEHNLNAECVTSSFISFSNKFIEFFEDINMDHYLDIMNKHKGVLGIEYFLMLVFKNYKNIKMIELKYFKNSLKSYFNSDDVFYKYNFQKYILHIGDFYGKLGIYLERKKSDELDINIKIKDYIFIKKTKQKHIFIDTKIKYSENIIFDNFYINGDKHHNMNYFKNCEIKKIK